MERDVLNVLVEHRVSQQLAKHLRDWDKSVKYLEYVFRVCSTVRIHPET